MMIKKRRNGWSVDLASFLTGFSLQSVLSFAAASEIGIASVALRCALCCTRSFVSSEFEFVNAVSNYPTN